MKLTIFADRSFSNFCASNLSQMSSSQATLEYPQSFPVSFQFLLCYCPFHLLSRVSLQFLWGGTLVVLFAAEFLTELDSLSKCMTLRDDNFNFPGVPNAFWQQLLMQKLGQGSQVDIVSHENIYFCLHFALEARVHMSSYCFSIPRCCTGPPESRSYRIDSRQTLIWRLHISVSMKSSGDRCNKKIPMPHWNKFNY